MLFIFAASVWLGVFLNKDGIYEPIHQFVFFRIDHAFVALSFMIIGFGLIIGKSLYKYKLNLERNKQIAREVCLSIGRYRPYSRLKYRVILRHYFKDAMKRGLDLTDDEVTKIRKAMEDYKVEGDLRREVALNIKRLTEIGCYRGIRHRRGLPVRGQRTKTNARTRKGPRKLVSKSKK